MKIMMKILMLPITVALALSSCGTALPSSPVSQNDQNVNQAENQKIPKTTETSLAFLISLVAF
jgi:PBP1b-binding outer membrane lipoprotein LpoB